MQATENPFPDQENKEPPSKKAKSQLFSFMEDEDDDAVNVTGKSILDDEIDCYLKKPSKKIHVDLLRFWEENTETYPRISKNAEKGLSILASSAAVERLFGKIYRPE